jgi:hypothetical protein
LEEAILVKSISDFNNAKFADPDHKILNGLIADVFPESTFAKTN